MRKYDLISTSFWFVIGLSIALYAPQFDLGTASMPGTGLMPCLAGIVMCFFAAISFVQALGSPSGNTERIWHDVAYPKILAVLIVLIAYAAFFEWIGFIVCTFVMMYVLMNFVGSMKWFPSLFGALVSALVAYFVFEIWLQAQLPKGILSNIGV